MEIQARSLQVSMVVTKKVWKWQFACESVATGAAAIAFTAISNRPIKFGSAVPQKAIVDGATKLRGKCAHHQMPWNVY
jgi:hypothetical protein